MFYGLWALSMVLLGNMLCLFVIMLCMLCLLYYSPAILLGMFKLFNAVKVGMLKVDKTHFQECVLDMLSEMFGEDCVGKLVKGDKIQITVNEVEAIVNITSCVSVISFSVWWS